MVSINLRRRIRMYKGTLIAVKNMQESKKFYHDILDMNVVSDFGANVQLDDGLFLQTLDTWSDFINHKFAPLSLLKARTPI